MKRNGSFVVVLVLSLLLVAPTVGAAPPESGAVGAAAAHPERSWEFVDLATEASALGINDQGQVVEFLGWYYGGHAFVWDARSGLVDIHEAAGLSSEASVGYDINNQGTVVGWRINGYDTLVWNEREGLIDITPGFMSDMARAINSSGQIVGGGSGLPGFTWDSRDGFTALPALLGGSVAEATAVNDRGQVAGRSGTNAVVWHPDGTVEDLGVFGGDWVFVTGINNRGQVVGSWFGYQLYNRGFLWDPRQGAIDLGEDFQPEAINNAGEIVGRQWTSPAFMDSNGDLTLLPLPEAFRSYGRATDINNRGVIVGYVDDQDWITHAVMWIPSP